MPSLSFYMNRSHILQVTAPGLDENQFAYRPKRGAEDSLLTLLHRIFKHLDKQDVYARVLFIDFSSAFNTIQPHIMVNNLLQLNIPEITCLWILEFLTNRKQSVRVNSVLSSQCTIHNSLPDVHLHNYGSIASNSVP